jgi:hypothetical protein
MFGAGIGLTTVSTEALKTLLKGLHKGTLAPPLTIEALTRHGLQYCAAELLGHLRTLDNHGMQAVLVAVIAERNAVAARSPVRPAEPD